MNWYAVYTRPQKEKWVMDLLHRENFEVFCPMTQEYNGGVGGKKNQSFPLFTSYFFVRTTEEKLMELRRFQHIVNLVYWLQKPAIISSNEMEAIKNFTSQYNNSWVEPTQVHRSGAKQVVDTSFDKLHHSLENGATKMISVMLPTLGFNLCAVTATANVKVFGHKENKSLPLSPFSIGASKK